MPPRHFIYLYNLKLHYIETNQTEQMKHQETPSYVSVYQNALDLIKLQWLYSP